MIGTPVALTTEDHDRIRRRHDRRRVIEAVHRRTVRPLLPPLPVRFGFTH
jgi:hypothetical protein